MSNPGTNKTDQLEDIQMQDVVNFANCNNDGFIDTTFTDDILFPNDVFYQDPNALANSINCSEKLSSLISLLGESLLSSLLFRLFAVARISVKTCQENGLAFNTKEERILTAKLLNKRISDGLRRLHTSIQERNKKIKNSGSNTNNLKTEDLALKNLETSLEIAKDNKNNLELEFARMSVSLENLKEELIKKRERKQQLLDEKQKKAPVKRGRKPKGAKTKKDENNNQTNITNEVKSLNKEIKKLESKIKNQEYNLAKHKNDINTTQLMINSNRVSIQKKGYIGAARILSPFTEKAELFVLSTYHTWLQKIQIAINDITDIVDYIIKSRKKNGKEEQEEQEETTKKSNANLCEIINERINTNDPIFNDIKIEEYINITEEEMQQNDLNESKLQNCLEEYIRQLFVQQHRIPLFHQVLKESLKSGLDKEAGAAIINSLHNEVVLKAVLFAHNMQSNILNLISKHIKKHEYHLSSVSKEIEDFIRGYVVEAPYVLKTGINFNYNLSDLILLEKNSNEFTYVFNMIGETTYLNDFISTFSRIPILNVNEELLSLGCPYNCKLKLAKKLPERISSKLNFIIKFDSLEKIIKTNVTSMTGQPLIKIKQEKIDGIDVKSNETNHSAINNNDVILGPSIKLNINLLESVQNDVENQMNQLSTESYEKYNSKHVSLIRNRGRDRCIDPKKRIIIKKEKGVQKRSRKRKRNENDEIENNDDLHNFNSNNQIDKVNDKDNNAQPKNNTYDNLDSNINNNVNRNTIQSNQVINFDKQQALIKQIFNDGYESDYELDEMDENDEEYYNKVTMKTYEKVRNIEKIMKKLVTLQLSTISANLSNNYSNQNTLNSYSTSNTSTNSNQSRNSRPRKRRKINIKKERIEKSSEQNGNNVYELNHANNLQQNYYGNTNAQHFINTDEHYANILSNQNYNQYQNKIPDHFNDPFISQAFQPNYKELHHFGSHTMPQEDMNQLFDRAIDSNDFLLSQNDTIISQSNNFTKPAHNSYNAPSPVEIQVAKDLNDLSSNNLLSSPNDQAVSPKQNFNNESNKKKRKSVRIRNMKKQRRSKR